MPKHNLEFDTLPGMTVQVEHDPVNGVLYTNVLAAGNVTFGYAFAGAELRTETEAP